MSWFLIPCGATQSKVGPSYVYILEGLGIQLRCCLAQVCVFLLVSLLMGIYLGTVMQPLEMNPEKTGLWLGSLLVQVRASIPRSGSRSLFLWPPWLRIFIVPTEESAKSPGECNADLSGSPTLQVKGMMSGYRVKSRKRARSPFLHLGLRVEGVASHWLRRLQRQCCSCRFCQAVRGLPTDSQNKDAL